MIWTLRGCMGRGVPTHASALPGSWENFARLVLRIVVLVFERHPGSNVGSSWWSTSSRTTIDREMGTKTCWTWTKTW